ncbi:MAG TPA: hypothetical protein VGB45_06130 [Abditibacterium sp.]|jgi:hypothetical protein
MGKTFLNLRQVIGKALSIGSSAAGDNGLLTIEKGDGAASQLGLDVKGSAAIGGDLAVAGTLIITGSLDRFNVTDLDVKDKTITVNSGGTTALAGGSGLQVEGDAAAVLGAIRYDGTKTNKWTVGDGADQKEIATVDQLGGAGTYFRATTVTGTQDTANKSFTLGNSVSAGSEQLFLNGQLLTPGSTNDYLLAGTALTFQAAADAPAATDVVRVYGVY